MVDAAGAGAPNPAVGSGSALPVVGVPLTVHAPPVPPFVPGLVAFASARYVCSVIAGAARLCEYASRFVELTALGAIQNERMSVLERSPAPVPPRRNVARLFISVGDVLTKLERAKSPALRQ